MNKKCVRKNLLKLRGQKFSEAYQVEFQNADYEWLEKNKDYKIF